MKTLLDVLRNTAVAASWRFSGGRNKPYILPGLILALVVIGVLTLSGGLGQFAGKGARISWAAPLASIPISTLEGDEIRPAVALSPEINSYLVVWQDHNDSSQTVYSISSVLAGEDGVPYQDPYSVSGTQLNKCLKPDVASNIQTGEFLVVWEYAYNEYVDHNIYARRVGNDGIPVGNVIAISTSTTYETSPSVAYNSASNQWLIVWDSAIDVHNRDINAATVDAGGVVQTRSTIASGLDDQANPSIAYGSYSGEFMVVWEHLEYTSENLNLAAQRVAADGTPTGSVIPVSTWEYEQVLPNLVYNPDLNEFLVVWEDHHWAWGDTADIYGQRISANGSLVGGNFGISWEESNLRLNPDAAYNANTHEYLVTWEFEHSSSDHDVYQRRVSSNGDLPGGEIPISNLDSWEGLPACSGWERIRFPGGVGGLSRPVHTERQYLRRCDRPCIPPDGCYRDRHLDSQAHPDTDTDANPNGDCNGTAQSRFADRFNRDHTGNPVQRQQGL